MATVADVVAAHRVLIVGDEHDIAGLIKHTLERMDETEAEIVGSGDAALKAVADHPRTEQEPCHLRDRLLERVAEAAVYASRRRWKRPSSSST